MKKDLLKDDLVSPKKIRFVFLILLSVFSLWVLWGGIHQIKEINTFINALALNNQKKMGEKSLELGSLKITNVKARDYGNRSQLPQWKMYVSVMNLDYQTPSPLRDSLLLDKSKQNRKLYGVEGHPSFIIHRKDLSFWKQQFYLQTTFEFGGLFIISIFYILIIETKYRHSKFFITPIKNFIQSLALLLLLGLFIKWGLDFWLFNFLNTHYYLGENVPPLDHALYLVGTATFILGVFLEQAVRLQKEQDLTI